MAKFKVGDRVRVTDAHQSCSGRTGTIKEKDIAPWIHFDDHRPDIYALGVREFGIPEGHAYFVSGHYLEPIPPDDDVIRVGDTVELVNDEGVTRRWKKGSRHIVTRVFTRPGLEGQIQAKDIDGLFTKRFKKIKAGGPVSVNKTTSSHEQIPSELASVRHISGEGRPVGARRPAGRTVAPVTNLGHPTRSKERRALVASPQVQVPTGCKSNR